MPIGARSTAIATPIQSRSRVQRGPGAGGAASPATAGVRSKVGAGEGNAGGMGRLGFGGGRAGSGMPGSRRRCGSAPAAPRRAFLPRSAGRRGRPGPAAPRPGRGAARRAGRRRSARRTRSRQPRDPGEAWRGKRCGLSRYGILRLSIGSSLPFERRIPMRPNPRLFATFAAAVLALAAALAGAQSAVAAAPPPPPTQDCRPRREDGQGAPARHGGGQPGDGAGAGAGGRRRGGRLRDPRGRDGQGLPRAAGAREPGREAPAGAHRHPGVVGPERQHPRHGPALRRRGLPGARGRSLRGQDRHHFRGRDGGDAGRHGKAGTPGREPASGARLSHEPEQGDEDRRRRLVLRRRLGARNRAADSRTASTRR